MTTRVLKLILVCAVCTSGLVTRVSATPVHPPTRENIQMHQMFTNPDEIEAFGRELEKEGVPMDNENDIPRLRNSLNRIGYDLDTKKLQNHRPQSTSWGLSERVFFPSDLLPLISNGPPKRNFDEIDRTDFSSFEGKRTYGEIGRGDYPLSFTHKRNIDEIDTSGFNGFARKRNIDEIDRSSGFSDFGKRSLAEELYRFAERRPRSSNFDEIDRAGFHSFKKLNHDTAGELITSNKRNFDEIDRSGFPTFNKRSRRHASR